MVRVISQATYDDVVRENMEELDMSPEEAVKDAIEQFEAQGVDLANIIKDLALSDGQEQHIVSTAVAALQSMQGQEGEALIQQLSVLKSECEKELARRVRAAREGAYPLLLSLLEKSLDASDDSLTLRVLETVTSLMVTQPDLLDDKGVDLIKRLLESRLSTEIIVRTLRWISTCCVLHENNRQAFFKSELLSHLQKYLKESPDNKILTELLQVFRRLVLDDDIRVEFGKAHDHAREIAAFTLTPLTKLLTDNTNNGPLASDIMLTIAALLVRNEFCQTVADAGAPATLFQVTTMHYDNAAISQRALKLIKALAGNDDVKRQLVKSGIAPVIVSLLNRHLNNPTATALSLSCITALTLREPKHSEQFVASGAAEAIVGAMKRHPDDLSVQRNACWSMRNMVARSRQLSSQLLELGAESSLNAAREKFSELEADTKAALRDLGCDVKLEEQWRGRGVQMSRD